MKAPGSSLLGVARVGLTVVSQKLFFINIAEVIATEANKRELTNCFGHIGVTSADASIKSYDRDETHGKPPVSDRTMGVVSDWGLDPASTPFRVHIN